MRPLRGLVAASTVFGFVAKAQSNSGSPTTPPPSAATFTTNVCNTEFYNRTYTLSFENLGPFCYMGCGAWKESPVTYPRGGGWSYQVESQNPIFLGNIDNWYALNCANNKGTLKGEACGVSNRALYSPTGGSPHQEGRPMRFNTIDHGAPYQPFDLLALSVFPFVDTPNSQVTLNLVGLLKNGGKRYFSSPIQANTMNKVTIGASADFKGIQAFDIWVQVAGSSKKWPFTLDDILWNEYLEKVKPTACTTFALPSGSPGPCKPKPTATTTIKVNFDEIPYQTSIPQNYKGISWSNDYIAVFNRTTVVERFQPGLGYPIAASGKNFITYYDNLAVVSDNYNNRFGLEEVAVWCYFPAWVPPEQDYLKTNDKPCVVTFVGRRDPYDGSGLPTLVEGSITIQNPGKDNNADRPFTKVKLASLTKDKSAFRRLVRIDIYTELGKVNSEGIREFTKTSGAFDSFVFSRELGEGENCRIKGKIINFDNLPANSFVNTPIDGISFGKDAWKVTPRSLYSPGTPGYISVVSQPNSIFYPPNTSGSFIDGGFDSYISPAQSTLFDFISTTITVNIPATDKARLSAYYISIQVTDACGTAGLTEGVRYPQRPLGTFYSFVIYPGKQQIKFARPYRAISKIAIGVGYPFGSPFFEEPINYWVDNLETKKYEGPIPACQLCAFRGQGTCENPVIPR